jgi:hypothetical protein
LVVARVLADGVENLSRRECVASCFRRLASRRADQPEEMVRLRHEGAGAELIGLAGGRFELDPRLCVTLRFQVHLSGQE